MSAFDPLSEDPIELLVELLEEEDLMDAEVMDSSSSEEEETQKKRRIEKSPNKNRDFASAYHRLIAHYFNGRESLYSEADFERRFRCPRDIFGKIERAVMGSEPFQQKKDATGKMGIHPLVKLVGCFRFLAYGDSYDREDENLHIAKSTLRVYVQQFAKLVIKELGPVYLNRPPTPTEKFNLSRVMAAKGFPGCMGSWDCKHFVWKNCPMRLAGQHQGHSDGGKKTLILEAISDHRRYIWQCNFGDAGSANDLNVLDESSIVGSMLNGTVYCSL